MTWLWLISVGVSDVQFPVWERDARGEWHFLHFEIGRGGVRAIHEGLMTLLQHDRITFPTELPKAAPRALARDLKLDLRQEDGNFVATISHTNDTKSSYQISHLAREIPNETDQMLRLFCPKVQPLLDPARTLFAGLPASVVVLNTRREEDWIEGPNEPVASGPLVAKFLAERLGLTWLDHKGEIPCEIEPNTSTWVDILTDREAMEDTGVQQKIVARLTHLIRAWQPARGGNGNVVVTVSGGLPPLKPFVERVPATFLGQRRVKLLAQPERGPVTSAALNYEDCVVEQETLRFHCAEALRSGDYASAYGLASRAKTFDWTKQVRDLLAPLLGLSSTVLKPDGVAIKDSLLTACQIEVCLCMHDIAGALKLLGLFLESSISALIENDARVWGAELCVDYNNGEILIGSSSEFTRELSRNKMLEENKPAPNRHRMLELPWRWPSWLVNRTGRQLESAKALKSLFEGYNGTYTRQLGKPSPRDYRNRLVHSRDDGIINLDEVKQCLEDARLLQGVGKPFGQNFLVLSNIKNLLIGLGAPCLTNSISNQINALLNAVIEG